MEKELIIEGKKYVEEYNLEKLKNLYSRINSIIKENNGINYQNIFMKIFFHSCHLERVTIIEFLMDVYNSFDPICKLGLRQCFFYGKYLIKNKTLMDYYDKNIISKIRIN